MKRILVALDGSDRARGVLDAARTLAELTGARLVLFRAIGLPPDVGGVARELIGLAPDRLEETLGKAARDELAVLGRTLPDTIVEAVDVAVATPWDGIVRHAREVGADLIVIGSHGYGGLDRVLGTTAAKVANHADRNVLIVRAPL